MGIENIVLYHALGKLKGVGRKTLESLPVEVLQRVNDEDDFIQLYDFLRGKVRRIGKYEPDALRRILDAACQAQFASREKGIIGLTRFDEGYPEMLKEIDTPPVALYVKGNLNCLNQNAVAVIGTRNPSPYALKLGERLGTVMAERGFVVVSGLAEGCDTAGHKGCISAGRSTVAILGNSLDDVYPKSNVRLAEEIIETGGCLISELPYGTPLNRYNFVERDRLQAGMSLGVLVVEMGIKSGTSHAVNAAIKAGKPVGCIAYDSRHYDAYENSRGNRELIANGDAIAITDAASIDYYLGNFRNQPSESISLF